MDEIKNMLVQLLEGQEEIKIEVRKNSIAIENIQKDLKQLAEVQENHYEKNLRNHKQIVEMLVERIDVQDKAIKNISVIK